MLVPPPPPRLLLPLFEPNRSKHLTTLCNPRAYNQWYAAKLPVHCCFFCLGYCLHMGHPIFYPPPPLTTTLQLLRKAKEGRF